MNTKRENSLVIIAPLRTNAKRPQATAAEATLFFLPEISANEIRVEVHNVNIKRGIRGVTCFSPVLVFANISSAN